MSLPVSAYLTSLTFSDGTRIDLSQGDIVVFVGPNNSGKSVALKGIEGLVTNLADPNQVVQGATLSTSGTSQDLLKWFNTNTTWYIHSDGNQVFQRLGAETWSFRDQIPDWDDRREKGMGSLAPFFLNRITTEDRLSASNAPNNVRLLKDPMTHPIHILQTNEEIEKTLGSYVGQAFGLDIRVHRNAGNEVPLMCGEAPECGPGEDRLSSAYLRRLDQMQRVEWQGDGIRSFVGLLLHALTIPYNWLLIDEPEAFLHPPQARLMGKFLATEVPAACQLFLATHSGDVIKGLMDGQNNRVRVVRITRDGNINRVKELSNADIVKLWSDPLVRHSSVLDGLFHRNVVVCESEGDCRFFEAMLAATLPETAAGTPHDLLFLSAAGKDRLHVIATALKKIGVPLAVVADFDVIAEQSKFQTLAEVCGLSWGDISNDWRLVLSAVEKRKPEFEVAEVRAEILKIIDACATKSLTLPDKDAERIRRILRKSSSWQSAKNAGTSLIPSGDEAKACQRLLQSCKERGFFILACGELERFCTTIGGHGPTWVNEVLQRDLKNDPELRLAREFVQELLDWTGDLS
jgi:energy-coupling factor transporter ATP-binding protein EcfA2